MYGNQQQLLRCSGTIVKRTMMFYSSSKKHFKEIVAAGDNINFH
jgi:hypothetical protein